ncbi:hypothetical protein [Paenirhodobacter sp.]|uniref:hypothetical protein n=1 Tax=Paenirhodobacter sp. TaxID=1965326 RepID=UPI003B4214AD
MLALLRGKILVRGMACVCKKIGHRDLFSAGDAAAGTNDRFRVLRRNNQPVALG